MLIWKKPEQWSDTDFNTDGYDSALLRTIALTFTPPNGPTQTDTSLYATAKLSASWYQPATADFYHTIRRYSAGTPVLGYCL